MRLVCVADLHGFQADMTNPIPDGDVLIVAGDSLKYGGSAELEELNTWLGAYKAIRKFKEIILIAGNHDMCMQKMPRQTVTQHLTNAIYMEDSSYVIDGVKFYGSPWTPTFGWWAFMESEEELEERWNMIPEDTDILITHGPAYGYMDWAPSHMHAGSVSLRKLFDSGYLKNLKAHIFGHIHAEHGRSTIGNIQLCNASICTEAYQPLNAPIVVEI